MFDALAPLLAAAVLSATEPPDTGFEQACMEELGMTVKPETGGNLTRLRRCINAKRLSEEQERKLERRLQRLDQHFWRHREQTQEIEKRSAETDAYLRRQKQLQKTQFVPGSREQRGKLLRDARTQRRVQMQLLERSGSGSTPALR